MVDEMTEKGLNDGAAIREMFDRIMPPMPIWAARIGHRDDSTPADRRLGDWLFKIAREWQELRAADRGEVRSDG